MRKLLHHRLVGALLCTVLIFTLAGCFTVDPQSGPGNGLAYITDVRTGNDGTVDRVVFEFAVNALPDWQIRYDAPPFIADGSGLVVPVRGHAYLTVRLQIAYGYPYYNGPRRFNGNGTSNVTEAVNTGDFEGVVHWVIGLNDFRRYQVTVLDSPKRLVIDVQH